MPTVTRTDVHRPVEMDPAAYEYLFAADTGPGGLVGLMSTDEGRALWSGLINNLAPETAHRGTSQCHHCGARIRYVAFLRHLPTGKNIVVGETCLDGRFALASKAEFDRLRKAAELDRQAQRIKTAAAEFVASNTDGDVNLALHRETDIAAEFGMDPNSYEARTMLDIRAKLWKYGDMSPRALKFFGDLLARGKGAEARRAAIQAERDAEVKMTPPSGRVEFTGTVVSRKIKDGDFGTYVKLAVKVEVPGRGVFFVSVNEGSTIETQRGDKIRMKATLTPSTSPEFSNWAFGKRPSNVVLIERPSEAPEMDALAEPNF